MAITLDSLFYHIELTFDQDGSQQFSICAKLHISYQNNILHFGYTQILFFHP